MSKLADQKILIAGCGAIGSVIGCLLKQAGHDVTLLAVLQDLNAGDARKSTRSTIGFGGVERHWESRTPYNEVVTRLIWQREGESTPSRADTGERNSNRCRSYVK